MLCTFFNITMYSGELFIWKTLVRMGQLYTSMVTYNLYENLFNYSLIAGQIGCF